MKQAWNANETKKQIYTSFSTDLCLVDQHGAGMVKNLCQVAAMTTGPDLAAPLTGWGLSLEPHDFQRFGNSPQERQQRCQHH